MILDVFDVCFFVFSVIFWGSIASKYGTTHHFIANLASEWP
jgi:hypothetical protein